MDNAALKASLLALNANLSFEDGGEWVNVFVPYNE
jgi:hypothetical protein